MLDKVVGQSSKEGTKFTILGKGDVELQVIFNGMEHILIFHNFLHTPDIMANLLSISRMDLARWNVVFGNCYIHFFNKDKTKIFGGMLTNGLYLVTGSFNMAIPTALTANSL